MVNQATADSEGGGGRLLEIVGNTQTNIRQLFDQAVAADESERGKAVDEALKGQWCPDRGAAEAEFNRNFDRNKARAESQRDQINEILHKFRNSSDAGYALRDKANEWRQNASKYGPILDLMNKMYNERDKWTGMAGAEYWSKLPEQIQATTAQKQGADDLASEMENTAKGHLELSLKVWGLMLDLEYDLRTIVASQVGGNGAYFLRMQSAVNRGNAFVGAVNALGSGDQWVYIEPGQRTSAMVSAQGKVPTPPPTTGK